MNIRTCKRLMSEALAEIERLASDRFSARKKIRRAFRLFEESAVDLIKVSKSKKKREQYIKALALFDQFKAGFFGDS